MSLTERWSHVLAELARQGRLRSLRLPLGIDFTSNDYLGYGSNPPQSRLDQEPPLSRSGLASRLLRGHHAIWDDVETLLAEWHGAEAVVMMTSGYAANEGLLSTLIEPGDWVAVDALCHASLIDGLRLARPRKFIFQHNNLNHLEEGLKSESARRLADRELFIVTESLFSMDGDRAPLRELVALAEQYDAYVVIDEAHATGCFGPRGSGCVDELGLRNRILATVHTGGKALGVPGAYLCGSRLMKEYLVNRCRHLIYTTALPPLVGRWWRERIPQIQANDAGRHRLHSNAAILRESLSSRGIETPGSHYIVPVILGHDAEAVRVAATLQHRGYDIRAIRPPSVPAGTARLRISIHADHHPEVLFQLAADIEQVVRI